MAKKKHLQSPQTIAVGDVLRKTCRTVDGCAVYEPGWDDGRVATEVNRILAIDWVHGGHVASVRKLVVGKFPTRTGTRQGGHPDPDLLQETIARLTALEAWARQCGYEAPPAPNGPLFEITGSKLS